MSALFLYCRPGFEKECAAEIQAVAGRHGLSGYCSAHPGTGYVIFTPGPPLGTGLTQLIELRSLVFTRQWFSILAHARELSPHDRISPLMGALGPLPGPAEAL